MEVSCSGYYNYFTEKSAKKRVAKEETDEVVKEIILKSYYFQGRKKGARRSENIKATYGK